MKLSSSSTTTENNNIIQGVTLAMGGRPIAIHVTGDPVTANNGYFYFHTDHLGSTSYLTKSTGSKLASSDARYQPFGTYRTTPSQTITDTGFTGQKENRELGLLYYNARYYAPTLSRFISPDTLIPDPSHPQAFNRYSYTRNNPINRVDPSGHTDCAQLGDPSDIESCVRSSIGQTIHHRHVVVPKPIIPDALRFTTEGFENAGEYGQDLIAAIAEAIDLVSWALANALNAMYPDWNLTPMEAFLLVYGGTVKFVWRGAAGAVEDDITKPAWTKSSKEIRLYDGTPFFKVQWMLHELGHAFYKAIGGTTVTDAAQAFLDNNPGVGRQADDNYTGYAGHEVGGSLYWQQSSSTTASEQFADMFIGWVYGQWQAGNYANSGFSFEGYQMSNFINGNIPTWLNLVVQQ